MLLLSGRVGAYMRSVQGGAIIIRGVQCVHACSAGGCYYYQGRARGCYYYQRRAGAYVCAVQGGAIIFRVVHGHKSINSIKDAGCVTTLKNPSKEKQTQLEDDFK